MSLKIIMGQVLKLVKAYRASKRGQKRVWGVASLFGGMVDQLNTGIGELEAAKLETRDRIDELNEQLNEQNGDVVKAHRLLIKLKELTA